MRPSVMSRGAEATGAGSLGGSPPPPVDRPVVPTARRLRQPSWRDARLLIGVTLVLLSVVAGGLVVSAADRTSPAYVAVRPLVPGHDLSRADVKVVGLRVTEGQSRYVAADVAGLEGRFVLAPVGAGELIPLSSVGDQSQVDLRPVSVPVDPDVAGSLLTGSSVDVWVADPAESGAGPDRSGYQAPRRVASHVVVGTRSTRRGALGSSTTTAVQVLVEQALVPELISAVNAEARITLVPLPAGVRSGG